MNHEIINERLVLGRVISTGWSLFWDNLRIILPVLLIVYIPLNIVLSFINLHGDMYTGGLEFHPGRIILFSIFTFLISVIFTMSLAKIIESSLLGHPITWQDAIMHAFSRWGAVIVTSILATVILFLLTLLLIVPGIIWSIYYSFFVYVVALRGLYGKDALDYSKDIVKGQWWRVFGYLIVIGLLGVVAMYVVSIPFYFAPETRIIHIISSTATNIVNAIFVTMILVFFLNNDYLKRRGEHGHGEQASDAAPGGAQYDEPTA